MIRIDLTGNTYGKLKVINLAVDDVGKKKKWLCKCECGNEVVVSGSNLRSGHTTGCSQCQLREIQRKNITHNMSKTKLYRVWNGMKNRCENPNHKSYIDYGNCGISVCEEWHDSVVFIKWALKNGYKEGLEIDRINTRGNYEPTNCRWISRTENANNKTNNRLFEFRGKHMTLAEIARENNLNYKLLHKSISKGFSLEDAIRKQAG